MTALKEYARLESMGVWRESADAQRRDVIVSFGDSTLVIAAKNDVALAHWSLAAVGRVNPGRLPAIYSPDPDATETLEIEDDTMVAAIEKVRSLIARRRPQPGRLRLWLIGSTAAALAALALFWMPDALIRHTVSVLPPATRAEMGAELLTAITRIAGRPCVTDRGTTALTRLARQVLGPDGGRIVVVPDGVRTTLHLPGGVYMVNRDLIEDHETPDVIAGYLLAEALRRDASDPMEDMLRATGLLATVRLLTTGTIPRDDLDSYAERLLTAEPAPVANDALLARFAAVRVPSSPYAYAVDVTGETTLPLIEGDPMWSGGAEPVLNDADWVGLQGICGE